MIVRYISMILKKVHNGGAGGETEQKRQKN